MKIRLASCNSGSTEEWNTAWALLAMTAGVLGEWQDRKNGDPDRIAQIERDINRATVMDFADRRAEEDRTGILRRLLNAYRSGTGKHILSQLRREMGGEWQFYRLSFSGEPTALPAESRLFKGDTWCVVWIPAKAA